MAVSRKRGKTAASAANLGFEATLWAVADKLRSNMDAAEYKPVVLGLIFLEYVSDRFDDRRRQIERETADAQSEWYVRETAARYEVIEDRGEYAAVNVFRVPLEARWSFLRDTLLPKLLSGEVRMQDAERFLEAAG